MVDYNNLSKNELLSVLFILDRFKKNIENVDNVEAKKQEFITRFKTSKLERKTFLIRELIKKML